MKTGLQLTPSGLSAHKIHYLKGEIVYWWELYENLQYTITDWTNVENEVRTIGEYLQQHEAL
jgi:hypothetical protein